MNVPRSELPDMKRIAALARDNLPAHYRLVNVSCRFGADAAGRVPDDFEILIEYENHHDAGLSGSMDDSRAHHAWADPLLSCIRSEWPPSTIRIAFHEKLVGLV